MIIVRPHHDGRHRRFENITANTWLGTSIRPGLPYNPSLGNENTAATSTTLPGSTHHQQHHSHRSSNPFSSTSPHPQPVQDESATAIDASETPASGGRGNGGIDGARGCSSEGTDATALSLAGVGMRVAAMPKLVRPPRAVPAAEAAALAAAAAAAAGLARGWAGPCADGCGGASFGGGGGGIIHRAEGDGGGGRGHDHDGGKGDGGGRGGTRGFGADREKELRAVFSDFRTNSEDVPGRHSAALPKGTEAGESTVLPNATTPDPQTNPAVTDGGRIAAAELSRHDESNDQRRWRQHKHPQKPKHYKLSASLGRSISSFLPTTGGGTVNARRRYSGRSSLSVPPATLAAMTEEGLAAAELSMSAAVAAAAAERDHGLIRTIGRAKRGPCMWTLSASREIDGWTKSEKGERLRRSGNTKDNGRGPLWEAETAGGLLGPGETRVLVC